MFRLSMVKSLAVMSLMLPLCVQAGTTVYKVKNPDGSVSYSDEPVENAVKMDVEPVTTVPALQYKDIPAAAKETVESKAAYTELDIVSPGHDTAFYSGNGVLNISTKLSPELKKGHQYLFTLDGKTIATQSAGSLTVDLVDRGTHTVTVSVVDRQLKTLISAASTFTIHRPKISRPSN